MRPDTLEVKVHPDTFELEVHPDALELEVHFDTLELDVHPDILELDICRGTFGYSCIAALPLMCESLALYCPELPLLGWAPLKPR